MSDIKGLAKLELLLILFSSLVFISGQVIFNPDPEEDIQLQFTFLSPPVSVTTVQCYSSSPPIKVQYVMTVSNEVTFDIRDSVNNIPISGTCEESQQQYRVILDSLRFIVDPVLVGETFKLKATVDNREESSTLSKRTYSFPAPFNLTGSSEGAVLNSPFIWTCHVTSDYPAIEWYRGSVNLGQIGILNGICVTFGQNDSYIYGCQQSEKTFTLAIPGPTLTEELQGSRWRCQHVITGVITGSKFMKLNIIVPVTTISIYPGNGSSVNADENELVTFACTTNNAEPPPTKLWYIGSSDVTLHAGSNKTSLNLNVTREYHQMSVMCVAWNIANTANLSDSTILTVRFSPANNEELQIVGYTSDQVLYENNPAMINIYCRQPGGNPVANMTLTCGSKTGTNENTATKAIRRINLTNDRNLYGQQCVCTSTHINGYLRSRNISFIVHYPPSIPTISISSPLPWKAQGAYSLTCNTTPGNPAATTYIWKEGGSVLSVTSQTYEINPLKTTDNGRQLSCQVSNNFTLHENIEVKSSVTTIQVESPATFKTKESYLLAQPNITASIGIPFYCNPPVTTSGVSWINKTGLDDKPVESSEMISFSLVDEDMNLVIGQTHVAVRGQKAVMNITSVQTYHRGYYVLRIQNSPSLVASWGVMLDITLRPDPPRNLTVQCRDGIAHLSWGFSNNLGLDVSFQVFYREESEEKYTVVEKNGSNLGQSYIEHVEVLSIKPKVIYYFKVASKNINGLSEYTDSKACVIFDEASSTGASVGVVAGGITGAFIVLIAAMTAVMVVRGRRYRIGKGARSKENKSTFENYEDIQSPNRSNAPGTETGHLQDERSTYEELQTSRDVHTYDHVDNRTQYQNL